MTSLKKTSATLAVALILPLAMSTASFAQRGGGAPGGGAVGGGGGGHGGAIGGGAGVGGGGFAGGHAAAIGGGGFAARGGMGGPGPAVAASPGARIAAGPTVGARGSWAGGGWGGGGWHGGRWHHRGGGFWPGVAVGAALGSYAYYGGPDYYWDYGPDYYTDYSYYDDSAPVAVVGGDASYCARRYRSYDPASGTYLGYDGLRHPCP